MDWTSRRITNILENALREDSALRDATTYACIDPHESGVAKVVAKEECVLAGLGAVGRIFEVFGSMDGTILDYPDIASHPEVFDGVRLRAGQTIAVIRHNARVLLSCERVLLNVLQRLSGIATLTRKYVDAIAGTSAHILDTRKTVPGLRMLDKYAVHCGGGTNHRLDLSDGILIKNNHIALAGGIAPALEQAIHNRRGQQRIEIEVRKFEELEEALAHGAEAVLLDNMTPEQVRACVARVKSEEKWVPLEASGGVNLENVRAYAETGVDFISVGALTHSARAVDLSMRIAPA